MSPTVLDLNQLKQLSLDDLFRDVIEQRQVVTVSLPDGGKVEIRPVPPLEPLPELDGVVPEGWKDEVNA